MLYTGKGDDGKTGAFGSKRRISKSSLLSEALGTLDELNSFLGLCKIDSEKSKLKVSGTSFEEIVHKVQSRLFIVQAELAGADKTIEKNKVKELEDIINNIEKELPAIKTFFISGGTELAAKFDVARTLARRAERRVISVNDSKKKSVGEHTLAYLNRLSSLLYALARLTNHKFGIKEKSPDYK